jgi:hypothetical protein
VHITAQHASDDDNDSADEEVLLDNSPTSTVVMLRKGDTTRIKITNSSMTIMALVADNIILSRAEAEPLFVRERLHVAGAARRPRGRHYLPHSPRTIRREIGSGM